MSMLKEILTGTLGEARTYSLLAVLDVPDVLAEATGQSVPRALAAYALTAILFEDLLQRVPTGQAYVQDCRIKGQKVVFDHGAVRSIKFPQGFPVANVPNGQDVFLQVLTPLGFEKFGDYPLARLKMTGRAYGHPDLPESIPQFFVSELHVEQFSDAFQAAARSVMSKAEQPLTDAAKAVLAKYAKGEPVTVQELIQTLPSMADIFARWHANPTLKDYETLLAESAEAAWIATEGAYYNHATDRVIDVAALADEQRALGRPIKDALEVSSTGLVIQTAFKADRVMRTFVLDDGNTTTREVPGSFYEFITRKPLEDGALDLRFDSSNAQGIFKMTAEAPAC